MTRTPDALAAGAVLLLLLAGCPLPQPLADYPQGTVTPPRILMDSVSPTGTVVRVPAGCETPPTYDLRASLVDNDTSETVTVRWFVDYDPHNTARCTPVVPQEAIAGPGDEAEDPTLRAVSPYLFAPYDHTAALGQTDAAAAGSFHVVELVVSNGFDASADQIALCTPSLAAGTSPFRMPASEGGVLFETQTYRWVFVNVEQSADVKCP